MRESIDDDRYVARLTATAPYVFALRWARGRSAHHDVARAVAGAIARLLLRTEEDVEPVRDGAIDPLTELPSRTATLRHLDNVLAAAQRGGGRVGVLFIDLDGFKAINDTFGHAVGDQTLIEAARRMKESVRRNDFVGRLGGDEFVAMLTVVDDELEMVEAAQRFLERVLVEVQEGGFTSLVRASIGIAVSPDDGTTPEQLLQHADEALYAAKESGGNSVRWYRDGVSQEVRARREFRERLRDANFERDFMLCYQPIVSTSTMRVVGAEALVRWRHPSRGWLTPRTFLDFKGGAMASSALDVKVIRAVADMLRSPNDRLDARIHVNISNANSVVWSELEAMMRDVEDAADRLALEVREATMLADTDAGGSFMRHARRLGVPDRARRLRRGADLARGDGVAAAGLHQGRPPRHQPDGRGRPVEAGGPRGDRRRADAADPHDRRRRRRARTGEVARRERRRAAAGLSDRAADDGAGFRRLAALGPVRRAGRLVDSVPGRRPNGSS